MTDHRTREDRYQQTSDSELVELYRYRNDVDAITTLIRRHELVSCVGDATV